MTIEASHSEMLVSQFGAACGELKSAIEAVPDALWLAPTADDGRQVNVVAHHAASAHRSIADMLRAMAHGQPGSMNMDRIHANNAEHARRFAACTRSEVLDQHERCSAYALNTLRGFDDATLLREGELLAGRRMTVEQAIQRVLVGHPRQHAETIRLTVSAART